MPGYKEGSQLFSKVKRTFKGRYKEEYARTYRKLVTLGLFITPKQQDAIERKIDNEQ